MANTITLSVYCITINKRGAKDDLLILSDFNNGCDFLFDIETIVNGWKKNVSRGEKDDPITKTADQAFRLARKDESSYYNIRAGRYLTCMIESGEYGTEEDGVNVESGERSFRKSKKDALLKPFFFEFFIPSDSKYGFLIVERISNSGIYSVLSSVIKSKFERTSKYDDYVLQIAPLSVNKLVEKKMNALKYEAKKVEFSRVRKADLRLSKLSNQLVDDTKVRMSLVYSAPINGVMKLASYVKNLKECWNDEERLYKIDEDITCDDIKIQVNIEGQEKTLSLQKFESLGMSMDITKDVRNGNNGYPTFESIKTQSDILISYIVQQIPNIQDEKD